jgi:hypothetical protein
MNGVLGFAMDGTRGVGGLNPVLYEALEEELICDSSV